MEAFEAGQAAEKAKDYLTARPRVPACAALASATPLAEKAAARIDLLSKDPDIKPLFDRADKDSRSQPPSKRRRSSSVPAAATRRAPRSRRSSTTSPEARRRRTAKSKLEDLH